jgi:hypothetical protein
MGERLLDDVSDRDGQPVTAGASCRQQLRDLGERAVCHPVALPSPRGVVFPLEVPRTIVKETPVTPRAVLSRRHDLDENR